MNRTLADLVDEAVDMGYTRLDDVRDGTEGEDGAAIGGDETLWRGIIAAALRESADPAEVVAECDHSLPKLLSLNASDHAIAVDLWEALEAYLQMPISDVFDAALKTRPPDQHQPPPDHKEHFRDDWRDRVRAVEAA